ncbi:MULTISPECIES: hypothetical protein [Shewanella]|uniref:hypothetical protein n=1 Tax=Shewanella TaxID=22 RepID=UPI0006D68518|nr:MULTISPECIES: hypothetical protein [Shewanella]KPZ68428.1 hypothetical protein AN944_03571 [Shewanella sp. P1-14-1]
MYGQWLVRFNKSIVCILLICCGVANASPPSHIVGNWLSQQTDHIEILQINDDHSYLQIGLDLQAPDNSFAEWGYFNLSNTKAFSELPLSISFNPTFSNNPTKGFITLLTQRNQSHVYLNSDASRLQLNMDTLGDNSIDNVIEYQQLEPREIEGYWYNQEYDDLYAVLMLENGLYVQLQINFEHDDELTGMEWGQYQHQSDSGEVYFQTQYDDNQQTGFSRYGEIASAAFNVKLHDDQLIFLLDHNEDGIIDTFSRLMRKN